MNMYTFEDATDHELRGVLDLAGYGKAHKNSMDIIDMSVQLNVPLNNVVKVMGIKFLHSEGYTHFTSVPFFQIYKKG